MVGAAAIGFLTAATGATGLAFSLLGALPKDGPSEVEVDKEDGAERKLSTPLTTASSVLNVKDDEEVEVLAVVGATDIGALAAMVGAAGVALEALLPQSPVGM